MENKKVNPNQKAVALRYKPEDVAPKVVASGKGFFADKIIEKAAENDIKTYKNEELVEELTRVSLGDNIPPDLYEIVAQVLIYIDDLDKLEAIRKYAEK